MIVYLLLNTVNLKGYVGQHKGDTISKRWPTDLSGANSHLAASRDKYGASTFSREILGYASTQEELTNLEKLWILSLRTYDPNYGYNKTMGGERGMRTKDAIEANRRAHIGITYPNRNKKRFYTRSFWPLHSDEQKIKISKSVKARWSKEIHPLKGRKKGPSSLRGRIVINRKRPNPFSTEHKQNVSKWFKSSIWITNGLSNRRISSSTEIPTDWKLGRSSTSLLTSVIKPL